MPVLESEKRYLILAEGRSDDPHYGKTMRGVVRYGPHQVVAILDSERAGEAYEGIPIVATVDEAHAFGPTTALVGVAVAGGRLGPEWRGLLRASIEGGLDVEAGMHEFLADDPELAELAHRHGVELRDIRRPPADLSVPTGANLEHGATVVLTVGSDCAIGKKTMALELHLEAERRGLRSVFVPTGQTGIMIAGWGIAVDAVVSDFLAGAAERLVVEGAHRGDLLWVEGQGSLLHPQFSGVTLGLMHGAAPHALVLCHLAGAAEIEGCPGHPLLPLPELVELHERIALPARPAKVVAVALNTSLLADEEAHRAVEAAEEATRLVADDPVRFGAGRLVDAVLDELPKLTTNMPAGIRAG
jgi:D-glutamate N-acetyltransferase